MPKNLREIVQQMARENLTWGEERIADGLLLKLGIRAAPRTVAKYLKDGHPRRTDQGQRWATLVRNHAKAIVACDFFVSVSASFQLLYVFVAMEVESLNLAHERYSSSGRSLDHPAVPRIPHLRASVSMPNSRPGSHPFN